ncbi:hypothetical protein ASPWEDRAFT_168344 [Aspergillus wentii DTO 134E9]|uniref:FAD dependent oxidoreductase domain-containing protein n=1 Tax=Aspergillus wentii DTO 134E9 TaxID=1073089 RepID=A0A1L9RU33_ASPWE|nr:uncharacterized protein ASPWEDRAFT_168344 [Aspergillus wentii DTO 134E9]OJJ38435.1 hypothetical protein ASPWEDRAFT_168344 [Aspergillus wentii DTO 134E9]
MEYFGTVDPAYFDEKLVGENGYADWPSFRILGDKELAPHWVLNSPVYLKWLQGWAEQQGVKFIRAQVASIENSISIYREARLREGGDGHVDTVVNASGWGFEDPDSFPPRG